MRSLTKEQITEIIAQYTNGSLLKDITSNFDVNCRTISRTLRKNGIPRRQENLAGVLIDKDEEVIQLYTEEKFCTRQIAELFGCSAPSVRQCLLRNDIDLRDISTARRKLEIQDNFFDQIDTSDKAYILGWLYSDGYNYYRTNTVTLEINSIDEKILEYIQSLLGERKLCRRVRRHQSSSSEIIRLNYCSKKLSSRLAELGVVQAKARLITFPRWMSEELLPHFLRGCFDGDGTFGITETKHSKPWFCALSGQIQFLSGCSDYLNGLGITCGVSRNNLQISKQSSFLALHDYLYGCGGKALERKKDKADQIKEWITARTKAIST